MLQDFNQMIIPYYSPISAKGGRRRRKTRRHKKSKSHSKNTITRRRYHSKIMNSKTFII